MNALEEVSDDTNGLVARSEALSLLKEISSYEFILSLIIWYDILMETNIVKVYRSITWTYVLQLNWFLVFLNI